MHRNTKRVCSSTPTSEEIRAYYASHGLSRPGSRGWQRWKVEPTGESLWVNLDTGEWRLYYADLEMDDADEVEHDTSIKPSRSGGPLEFEMWHDPEQNRLTCLRRIRECIPGFGHYYFRVGSGGWFVTYDEVFKSYGRRLGPFALAVYGAIAASTCRKGPNQGKCLATQAELAELCGMSVRALRDAMKLLESESLLLVTPGQSRSVYELIQLPLFQSEGAAESDGNVSRQMPPYKRSEWERGAESVGGIRRVQ